MTSVGGGSTAETLDINQTLPKYFTGAADGATTGVTITITAYSSTAKTPTWCCTLTRIADTSSYGPYSVAYDQMGYIPSRPGHQQHPGPHYRCSTIVAEINPMGQ